MRAFDSNHRGIVSGYAHYQQSVLAIVGDQLEIGLGLAGAAGNLTHGVRHFLSVEDTPLVHHFRCLLQDAERVAAGGRHATAASLGHRSCRGCGHPCCLWARAPGKGRIAVRFSAERGTEVVT